MGELGQKRLRFSPSSSFPSCSLTQVAIIIDGTGLAGLQLPLHQVDQVLRVIGFCNLFLGGRQDLAWGRGQGVGCTEEEVGEGSGRQRGGIAEVWFREGKLVEGGGKGYTHLKKEEKEDRGREEGGMVTSGGRRDERPCARGRRDSRERTYLARNSSLVHPGPHVQSVGEEEESTSSPDSWVTPRTATSLPGHPLTLVNSALKPPWQ